MEYKYPQIDRTTGYAWLRGFIPFGSLSKSPRLSSFVQTLPTSTRGWRSPVKTINSILVSLRAMCSTYVLVCHSTLRHSIHNVVFLSSTKQVVWSNATAIIAMVANQLPFWNRAISKFIRNPMRQTIFTTNSKTAVTISRSRPFPTSFSFTNLTPKLFFDSHYHNNNITTHNHAI